MLPPESGGPDATVLAARVERYLRLMPAINRRALMAGCHGLDALALATTGRRLTGLDPERRTGVLRRALRMGEAGEAVVAVKAMVLLVAGAESAGEVLRARARATPPVRPDAHLDVTPARWWPSRSRCDVVVIGSGAGGAFGARTLARAGLDTVVIEEGRRFTVEEFRERPAIERFAELYRDAGSTIAIGRPPVVLPIGRGVGGTTLVNSGTCYPTPQKVLKNWRDDAGLDLADPDRFAPYLGEVETTLQVGPVPLDVMGRNGRLALAGAAALGWASGPLVRNAPGCDGCSQCAIGCPRNAKFGVHLNALPEACAAGARIVSEARVLRVLHAEGRVTGVLARRRDGSTLIVEAPRVVVAAGATETPPLLRRSGLGGHPEMGRNMALHPATSAAGRFEEPVVAWEGVLQSAAVDEFHESDGILVEATSTPPGMGSMALPGLGEELLDELAAADHLVTIGAMIGDEPSGAVLGRRRVVLRYDLSRRDGARLVKALGVMCRVLLAAGAYEAIVGVPGVAPIRSDADVEAMESSLNFRRLHVAAFHPTGTARMGADPGCYPVDTDGRLRGVQGLWVADACVLPTCPEVNPQETIMALALAIADRVTRT